MLPRELRVFSDSGAIVFSPTPYIKRLAAHSQVALIVVICLLKS